MAYTTIDKPTDYFDTKLHTGTGASKTLAYDFEVDFYWTKMRSDAYPNVALDSSRGNNRLFRVNQTNAEVAAVNTVSFGNASGVTLGSDSSDYGVNKSGETFVGWAWKANGGTTSSNTDGSITSTVQADTTVGFSIVTYTGTGSGATIGHGVGKELDFIIIKRRSDSATWAVYSRELGSGKKLELNGTSGTITNAQFFTSNPTSSVFSLGTEYDVNGSGGTFVAYCFAEIQGYSKFGSYTGNGNADGPFIYTGFKPAWVMIKLTSGTENWIMMDNKRDTFNNAYRTLLANASSVEDTSNDARYSLDFVSNGFKVRSNAHATSNGNGSTYIYMAFAEHPFVSSKGAPTTAR